VHVHVHVRVHVDEDVDTDVHMHVYDSCYGTLQCFQTDFRQASVLQRGGGCSRIHPFSARYPLTVSVVMRLL
jgi:hypothetical protein